MPFWINGWLEVRRGGAEDALSWSGVLRIGPLVDVADGVSERLFGLSKRLASASNVDAIAAQRGAPADPSEEVRAELDEQAAHEREFGPGELGGHTHATWLELADQLLDDAVVSDSDWKLVFDIARLLATDDRFKPDGVRFVLWYDW
jgi:hypothetical protein